MPPTELSTTVRQAREGKGWSRATLAKESGVGSTTIARIELRGDVPRVDILKALGAALDLKVGDLIERAA